MYGGCYKSAKHNIFPELEARGFISNHTGPIFFVGHSLGGSTAHILHVLAANERKYNSSRLYSVGFANFPSLSGFGSADPSHFFSFVLYSDPVPRFHSGQVVNQSSELEIYLTAFTDESVPPQFRKLRNLLLSCVRKLRSMGTTRFNIKGLIGTTYLVESTDDKSIIVEFEKFAGTKELGRISLLGATDHQSVRYKQVLTNATLLKTVTPASKLVRKPNDNQLGDFQKLLGGLL
jgi:hypothetical protein